MLNNWNSNSKKHSVYILIRIWRNYEERPDLNLNNSNILATLHKIKIENRKSSSYLVKERTLPFYSWNQIIFCVFFQSRKHLRDIFWQCMSYVEVVGLFWIHSIPNFFSLPFTIALNRRHNIRVVKDLSIKFLAVSFVLYLNNKTTKKAGKKKNKKQKRA